MLQKFPPFFLFVASCLPSLSQAQVLDEAAQRIGENTIVVNIVVVIGTRQTMAAFVESLPQTLSSTIKTLQGLPLKRVTDHRPIELTVNVAVVSFKNYADGLNVEIPVSLTNNRQAIDKGLRKLQPGGTGPDREIVVPALRKCLAQKWFRPGALNRIILIGDTRPQEDSKVVLESVGKVALAQYAQIDSYVCGHDPRTLFAFATISAASGGSSQVVKTPQDLVASLVRALTKRLEGHVFAAIVEESPGRN